MLPAFVGTLEARQELEDAIRSQSSPAAEKVDPDEVETDAAEVTKKDPVAKASKASKVSKVSETSKASKVSKAEE